MENIVQLIKSASDLISDSGLRISKIKYNDLSIKTWKVYLIIDSEPRVILSNLKRSATSYQMNNSDQSMVIYGPSKRNNLNKYKSKRCLYEYHGCICVDPIFKGTLDKCIKFIKKL